MTEYSVSGLELAEDLVDTWHTSKTGVPLHEFMGITHDEYKVYLERAELPIDFMARHGWKQVAFFPHDVHKIEHTEDGYVLYTWST